MQYKAKYVYKDENEALNYDKVRFKNIKGKIIDRFEKRLIHKAIKKTGLHVPARILDIPCGTGRISIDLALKGFELVGVDVSKAMVREAKKKIENLCIKNRISLQIGDAEALSFEDSNFDIVVCLRLFGHLPTDTRLSVLKEMSRVSKKFVITAYYNRSSIQGLLRRRKRNKKNIYWNPVNINQIDKELEKASLKRIAIFNILPGVSETVIVLARK